MTLLCYSETTARERSCENVRNDPALPRSERGKDKELLWKKSIDLEELKNRNILKEKINRREDRKRKV